ncbi:MAG: rhodanese-like domain-containing protein [Burkholderiaceae bacterium]|nr:rhodanese-like domain-containing protein [Burkholderiaceae bacterium]
MTNAGGSTNGTARAAIGTAVHATAATAAETRASLRRFVAGISSSPWARVRGDGREPCSAPAISTPERKDCSGGNWLFRTSRSKHLAEFRVALDEISKDPERLVRVGRAELIEQARRGEVVVLDVRPEAEYAAAHLPYARSMPLAELERRVAELPRNREIVAYCRGPFCLLSNEAVQLLSARGFDVRKLLDGVGEWQAAGMPLERTTSA